MQNPYQFDIKIKSQNDNKRKYYFDVDVSKNSIEHKLKSQLSLDTHCMPTIPSFSIKKSPPKRKRSLEIDLSSNSIHKDFKQKLTLS